jgi:hypothetical protein
MLAQEGKRRPGKKGTVAGFSDESPIKSPFLADSRKKPVVDSFLPSLSTSSADHSSDTGDSSEHLTDEDSPSDVSRSFVQAEGEAESSTGQVSQLGGIRSSSSQFKGRTGRPRLPLSKLKPRQRIERLQAISDPTWVISKLSMWWGVRYLIKAAAGEVVEVEINCFDLTGLVTFESRALPPSLQLESCQSEEEILGGMERLLTFQSCGGIKLQFTYLRKKFVSCDGKIMSRQLPQSAVVETIGTVRKVAGGFVQFHSLTCEHQRRTDIASCLPCRDLQIAIRDRKSVEHRISDSPVYARQLVNLDPTAIENWSPFLACYLETLSKRTFKTQSWSPQVTIFSLGLYCKLGKSYEEIRTSLPLPSSTTLKRLVSRIPAKPGISVQAIESFLHAAAGSPIMLAFDEIYFQSGLQMVRDGKDYRVIGLTSHGTWESPTPEHVRLLFGFQSDVTASRLSPVSLPLPQSEWSPSTNWCTDSEATTILAEEGQKQATMALHFLLSSLNSNVTQAIGYVECHSVTGTLLRALIFRIIKVIYEVKRTMATGRPPRLQPASSSSSLPSSSSSLPSSSSSLPSLPAGSSSAGNGASWDFYHSFADEWADHHIQSPSLKPRAAASIVPWLMNTSRAPAGSVVAVCFDGSSHARSMVRSISAPCDAARFFIHPLQPQIRIFCISDFVHLFKRLRNQILKDRILLAPLLNDQHRADLPNPLQDPHIYTATFNQQLYKQLVTADFSYLLAVSRLNIAAVELTPRSKMSFPLAKSLFAPKTIISLDALEKILFSSNDFSGAYLAYSAKAVAIFANQLLLRARSRWVLDGDFLIRASKQLFDLWSFFLEWKRRNEEFYQAISKKYPSQSFTVGPKRKRQPAAWGFFDVDFQFDLGMTVIGLSILCTQVDSVCLRLATTDCVESFFSTIRHVTGGGGQINVRSHRASARKATFLRLHLHSYIGDMLVREQPVIQALLAKQMNRRPAAPECDVTSLPVPDWEHHLVTDPELPTVHYVAGYLLRKLMKGFPEQSAFLSSFIMTRVRKLLRTTSAFEHMTERLLVMCRLTSQQDSVSQRPDLHNILCLMMLTHQAALISNVLGDDFLLHLLLVRKLSAVFIGDKLRRDKQIGMKSFRNALD